MEEEEEEQGGGEVGGHWELWLGTADWELWEEREKTLIATSSSKLVKFRT